MHIGHNMQRTEPAVENPESITITEGMKKAVPPPLYVCACADDAVTGDECCFPADFMVWVDSQFQCLRCTISQGKTGGDTIEEFLEWQNRFPERVLDHERTTGEIFTMPTIVYRCRSIDCHAHLPIDLFWIFNGYYCAGNEYWPDGLSCWEKMCEGIMPELEFENIRDVMYNTTSLQSVINHIA